MRTGTPRRRRVLAAHPADEVRVLPGEIAIIDVLTSQHLCAHREQRGTEIAAFLLGSNLHVPVAGSFVESLASVGMPVVGLRTNTVLPFQSWRCTVNVCANSSEAECTVPKQLIKIVLQTAHQTPKIHFPLENLGPVRVGA